MDAEQVSERLKYVYIGHHEKVKSSVGKTMKLYYFLKVSLLKGTLVAKLN